MENIKNRIYDGWRRKPEKDTPFVPTKITDEPYKGQGILAKICFETPSGADVYLTPQRVDQLKAEGLLSNE